MTSIFPYRDCVVGETQRRLALLHHDDRLPRGVHVLLLRHPGGQHDPRQVLERVEQAEPGRGH